MAKTIYNLFLMRRQTERWLRLSQVKQTALMTQINEGLAAAGGRHVVTCQAHWCNEGYRGWGVEEFPDFAAWRQFADLPREAGMVFLSGYLVHVGHMARSHQACGGRRA